MKLCALRHAFAALALLTLSSAPAVAVDTGRHADPLIARGRYVVTIGGCNDCHTPGYAASDGKVDEKDWLVGDALGWRGPWGTTYAANLRTYMQSMSEADWVAKAKTLQTRPPMPAMNVRAMTTADLRAVHRFVRSLGPAGSPAPAYVPPNQEPKGPVVTFPAPPK